MNRSLTCDERRDATARLSQIHDRLEEMYQEKAALDMEARRLRDRLMHGIPPKETMPWHELYGHLQRIGGTARVRFRPLFADLPEMEWVASAMGLNRYDANGANTATWHPDARDIVEVLS